MQPNGTCRLNSGGCPRTCHVAVLACIMLRCYSYLVTQCCARACILVTAVLHSVLPFLCRGFAFSADPRTFRGGCNDSLRRSNLAERRKTASLTELTVILWSMLNCEKSRVAFRAVVRNRCQNMTTCEAFGPRESCKS